MQVLILAGGLGTRIKERAQGLPKAMIPVDGRPFIEYQLEQLAGFGLTDVLLCVGFGGDVIEAHVGDGSAWGVSAKYSYEDPNSLLGTGGALVNALPKIGPEFMTLYGDAYLSVDFKSVIDRFHQIGLPYLMTAFKNDGQWDGSNTRVDGDRISFYDKKCKPGEADHIDYGLSVLKREVIERYANEPLPLDMARIQSELVASREMAAYLVTDRFYEIGKPEGLDDFEAWVRSRA